MKIHNQSLNCYKGESFFFIFYQAEKEELAENVEELKKQLLNIQLENTEMQEKISKMHETTRTYTVDTDSEISQAENELMQKIDMLTKQLET